MTLAFKTLAKQVREELAAYPVPPPRHPEAVGNPLPPEWFETGLAAMREALVEPYWADVQLLDTPEQSNADPVPTTPMAIVADDKNGSLVAFDPATGGFALLNAWDENLASINVRGDAVGCFLSR